MKHVGNPKIMVAVVGLLVVVGALVLLWGSNQKLTNSKTKVLAAAPPATAVIEITPSGFIPNTLSVSPNTDVIWVNEDVMPHLPAADPYPTHASLPSLVAPRALGQKETYTFLVTKKEMIHYHDDLNPTLTGTIEVR